MFTPLLDKIAEPPPPEGVSSKDWDKILQKGPPVTDDKSVPLELIRKKAEDLSAQRAFEELTSPEADLEKRAADIQAYEPRFRLADIFDIERMESIDDMDLWKVAATLAQAEGIPTYTDPSVALKHYEELGGTYKHAFGQQMFNTQQMAGSPAVSGGMSTRARTPAPQIQSAPVSVTTTSIGGQGQNNQQGGASVPTSAPSTPSAPTS